MRGYLLLEVKNMSVSFRTEGGVIPAVDNVSFSIGKKEILGIVGESGSGKSVTALSIMGLIPNPPGRVDAESIRFSADGRSVTRLDSMPGNGLRKIRGRFISMIFQEPMTSLNPVFTCGDQVSETLREHLGISGREARKRTLDLFGEVRLPDPPRIFRSFPHELSGGQKQRVMIAMAISCNPSLLIADEPTTALDVSVQKTILELLKQLKENRDMSILFITHDLGLIRRFADRVLVMYRGAIVEQGRVDEVFGHPGHPYTRGLIACRPPKDRRPLRLPVIGDFMDSEPVGEEPGAGFESDRLQEISSPGAGEPILRVERLGKSYTSGSQFSGARREITRTVEDMSFSIYPGETLGIVGESGSGKTTLSRTILHLIPPSEGRILFRNEDITTFNRKRMKMLRKELQIIFQDPYSSLNPRMTIGEAIREPLEVHHLCGNRRKQMDRVYRLLEMVGLRPDHAGRYPHEFSGGQRQRICIARAIGVEPSLIICDESVSALDVSIQAQILNLLNDLKRRLCLTYIFISHDLNVVKFMSDRLIVMKEGRIAEMGDADGIFSNPKTEYTRILLGAMEG